MSAPAVRTYFGVGRADRARAKEASATLPNSRGNLAEVLPFRRKRHVDPRRLPVYLQPLGSIAYSLMGQWHGRR